MTIKAKIKFDIKPVVFKIDADFESILESVKSYEGFYSKKNIKIAFLIVFNL